MVYLEARMTCRLAHKLCLQGQVIRLNVRSPVQFQPGKIRPMVCNTISIIDSVNEIEPVRDTFDTLTSVYFKAL